MQRIHVRAPGDTKLHFAARNSYSSLEYFNYILGTSVEELIDNAITTNNEGKLPIDVINPVLNESEREKIFSSLLMYATNKRNKPLDEPVNFEEILKIYQPLPESKLYTNLKNACELVNETREHVKTRISITHTDINGMDKNKYQKMLERQKTLHRNYERVSNKLKWSEARFEFTNNPDEILLTISQQTYDRLNINTQTILDGEINNCGEMGIFAYRLGANKNLNVDVYKYADGCGDHLFNAFLDHESKESYGGDTVFFDAWAPYVGTNYREIGDYKRYTHNGQIYNLIVKSSSFNKIIPIETEWLPAANNTFASIYECKFDDVYYENFVKSITDNLSAKDKFLFMEIIQTNFLFCMNKFLIDEVELESWTDRAGMLFRYFSADSIYLPFIIHAYMGDEECFQREISRALIQGANPDHTAIDGKSALYFSILHGYTNTAKTLLSYGANPDLACMNGRTPLIVAIEKNDIEMVKILLAANANPNLVIADCNGTVLFMAAQKNHSEIVELLLRHPGIELKSLTAHVNCLTSWVRNMSRDIKQRMKQHIQFRLLNRDKKFAIKVSPYEIAFILGHNEIMKKLSQFQRNLKQPVFSPHNLLFKRKADQTPIISDQCRRKTFKSG